MSAPNAFDPAPSPLTASIPDPKAVRAKPAANPPASALPLVILAGGLSRRMGQDKAFVTLAGRPMIAHLLERLRPQAGPVALNGPDDILADGLFAPEEAEGLPVVADPLPGRPGPLAGVLAAMRFARQAAPDARHVATVPVDTPFLPGDLIARLAAAVQGREAIAVAATDDVWHPIVALWPIGLADALRSFILTDPKRRVRGFIERHPHVVVTFERQDGRDPFDNLNTPDDLARAGARLAATRDEPILHVATATMRQPKGIETRQKTGEHELPEDWTRIQEPLPQLTSPGPRRVAVVHPAGGESAAGRAAAGEAEEKTDAAWIEAERPTLKSKGHAHREQPGAARKVDDRGSRSSSMKAVDLPAAGDGEDQAEIEPQRRPQRVLGVTGWKNSGKTTLVERLVGEFIRRGLTVSTIKHAHHDFDIDRPGADSHRHRQAGAREVAVVSNARFAIMHELAGAAEPDLIAILARMAPVDLVIVEGYKREPIPKIEARRRDARSQEPLAPTDPTIFAIAADHPAEDAAVPVLDLDDTEAIADLAAERLGLSAG